ncbi:hypothetical protein [Candidatus Methylomicrobium oryzae]|uniref:hypothetical protein n=1 Tax=Candidatus Methylomicrobium oryzae TaxID=2802053 RepID=UPI00192237B2|nr:hypothetical protein [Methylomicrobium sp. RS1]
MAFFNLKNRASRKAVIHEYKIEENSMVQIDPGRVKRRNIEIASDLRSIRLS